MLTRENIHTYVPWPIVQFFTIPDDTFTEHSIPLKKVMWLFDFGIVDANNDDRLDLYTINHNWQGNILIANEKGGYDNVYSKWGFDQSSVFPGLELSLTPPDITKPGLYIYWLDEYLIVRAEKLSELGFEEITGKIHSWYEPEIVKKEGFRIEKTIAETVPGTKYSNFSMTFAADGDKILKLKPSPQYPIRFSLDSLPTKHIHIGNQRISPKQKEFTLQLRDRHAMAWNDLNGDGNFSPKPVI